MQIWCNNVAGWWLGINGSGLADGEIISVRGTLPANHTLGPNIVNRKV